MNMISIKESAIKLADENFDFYKEIGSNIWEFSECSREEYKTSHYIMKKLESEEFKVERGVGGFPTGFIGEFSNGEGPVIGLLCEFDALPGLSSINTGKSGHGCGHNLFATGAIGTAIVLKSVMINNDINGKIKIFGTPSEEQYGCKQYYAKQGLFDGVDVFFGFHPGPGNGIPYKLYNSIISKKYKFYGTPSHAGVEPELGRSALDAVEIMNVAVNYLREHVTSDVRFHYVITKGGDAPNIVPAYAESHYAIRAQDIENLGYVANRIDKIANAAAIAMECDVYIEYLYGYANTLLNRTFAELANKNAYFVGTPIFDEEDQIKAKEFGSREGLPKEIIHLPDTIGFSGGSTDESDASWIAPWTRIGMATVANGTASHTVEMTIQSNLPAAYKGITSSIKVATCTAIDILLSTEVLKQIKDDYNKTINGRKYSRNYNIYPDAKYFPNILGVDIITKNKLSINLKKTILLQDFSKLKINIYVNDENIGHCIAEDNESDYIIALKKEINNNDVLIIKYHRINENKEILLGYINVKL